MVFLDIIFAVAAFAGGALLGLFVIRQGRYDENGKRLRGEQKIEQAKSRGEEVMRAAREHSLSVKENFAIEEREFALQIERMEKMLEVKAQSLQKREAKNTDLRNAIQNEERTAADMRAQVAQSEKDLGARLISITGISKDDAKNELIKRTESDFLHDSELHLQHRLESVQECAVREARNALAHTVYRYADVASIKQSQGKITVQRDEVKGRIVGRGGRTIAFFEELFGVDVIFNDEPNIIIVSCFNIVQEEIARLALERIMREKVIAEDTIVKAKAHAEAEMEKLLIAEGERALKILGIPAMPKEFAKLIGRLKYRTSYGQNVLKHSFEVGYFSKLLAAEIGADEKIAFYGGFFHDIGKAIDQEVGGSHDVLSKEILEKYQFSWEITHAAWTHHNAIPQETVEAKIVQAADAISAGRPGARAESIERYIARIKELQEIGTSFAGVKKAYAINAGRELRVIVDPEKVADAQVIPLAENIAAKVQEKGGYPGKIKILTIRSTKATEHVRKS